MSDYIDKTPSELITLLVDGELYETDASTLFESLSKNEDLRNELLSHLKMRESVRNDAEAFTPPIEATQGVFQKLGIAPPINVALNPTNGGAKFLPIFLRFGVPIVAILITSLITATIISNHYEAKIDELKNQIPVVSSISDEFQQENSSSNNIIASQAVTQSSNNKNVEQSTTVTKNNTILISQQSQELEVSQTIPSTSDYSNTYSNDITLFNKFEINKYNITFNRPSNIQSLIGQPELIYQTKDELPNSKNYLMTVGGVIGQNINSGINNMASGFNIGFYPITSKDIKIGFIFGREPFGIEILSSSNRQYENDPTVPITWAGVAGRYEFSSVQMFNSTHPFCQVILGATEYGMLSKASTGIQIQVFNNIETAIGLEYSLLRYTSQLQTHYNNKLSFTANLLFHF